DLSPGPETVDALLRSGHAQQARTVAREYQRRAVHKGQPWAMARAERGLGMTEKDEQFGAHFDAALALHKDTEDSFEVARTQLAYGSRLRRTRQRVAARPLLSAALTGFEALGAVPWADFAAVELEATGATASRRGDSARDRLTAQELQIALMLGRDGLTTRQAAAALFLSPKTVEYHLRHVYTKLGISSRRAMAAAVQR
ncbi:MAG: helix-turn-helix transcriptional regulator, partial [Aeromicrobium sp.]|uniref:helix-turn-helix transcriptional regulator n=1 Tax=Aeromicrobium sp. TaxID=1871063 RepID=UPI003C5BFC0E